MAEEIEDVWEYDAPQFVDFTKPTSLPGVDKWFERRSKDMTKEDEENEDEIDEIEELENDAVEEEEGEEEDPTERRLTQSFAHTPVNTRGLPEASEDNTPKKGNTEDSGRQLRKTLSRTKSTPSLKPDVAKDEKRAIKAPSNLCTDLNEWRSKTKNATVTYGGKNPVAGANSKSRKSVEDKKPTAKQEIRSATKTRRSVADNQPASQRSVDNDRASRSAALKRSNSLNRVTAPKLASSSSQGNLRSGHTRSTSSSRAPSQERRPRANSSCSSGSKDGDAPASKMPKITVPSTPTFMKRKPTMPKMVGKEVKSAEERELETIAHLRNEMVKKRKLAEESRKKAMAAPTCVKANKEATVPQEFQFQTDSRVKTHNMETRSASKERDFVASLRSAAKDNHPSENPSSHGPTKPQPFKLTENRKRKLEGEPSADDSYHSMAEKVRAFHRQTPDRFRRKPRSISDDTAPKSKLPTGVTVPKTPNLETRGRLRPTHAPSRQEEEEKEIEEMKKNQFKAHPVNHKIFENSCTGVKKVASKPTTEPVPFHLSDEMRVKDVNKSQEKNDSQYEFHAKPLNKKILEGPVGIKPKQPAKLTRAKSPEFACKNRVRPQMDSSQDSSQEESRIIKVHPAPFTGIPFQPRLKPKYTTPEPFSFEERQKHMLEKKEEKIHHMLEEEKKSHEFHANPMPSPTFISNLPMKHTKPTTKPEPFQLACDVRGAKRAQEWTQKMEEELRQQREAANFKAQQSDIIHKKPFMPEKSSKPLTDISEFELNTDKRATTREQFDMFRKAKEAEMEARRRQMEKLEEEEEKETVARLRKEMVHKANPVRHFKTVEVQPSEQPITCPMSPKFSTDRRLRSKVRV